MLTSIEVSAQDSLYIYKNGGIIYSSQTNQVDSVTFHPPGYWEGQRSEAVFESIQSYPELSIFAELLNESGYRTKLDGKTVWAPVNSALTKVDRSNPIAVRQLVENHLSEGMYYATTQEMPLGKVIMLNLKVLELTKTNNEYYLDGNRILNQKILGLQSHINIIDGCIPYRPNVWEYLNQASSTDSICQFIRSYNKTITNNIVANELLTNVSAALQQETSDFTFLIPDDKLWNKTIAHLMQLYPPTTDSSVTASRLNNVKRIIIKDLFLKGRHSTLQNDTLLQTTLGNELTQPALLFGKDSLLSRSSNGCILRINTLSYLNDSLRVIRTEAENPTNRTFSNVSIITYKRSSYSNFPISGDGFVGSFPLTTSLIQKTWIQFGIPNLLPGKYNIYADIVPAYFTDTTKILPSYLTCTVLHPNASGESTGSIFASKVTTNPKALTKLLIKSDFEVYFFNMSLAAASNPMIKVRVENVASGTQTSLYRREFFVDCIIFEPVR